MNALGNFLLGSYLTGFFFMLFFNDKIIDDPCPSSIISGIIWPVIALVFLVGRVFKAIYVFHNGSL